MKKTFLIAGLAVCSVITAHAEVDKERAHAIYHAADKGDVAQVRELAGPSPDQKMFSFLLSQAIRAHDFKAFTTLLNAGANPTYIGDGIRNTAMHLAVAPDARSTRFLQELLRRGVDVNVRNALGETPLFSALGPMHDPARQIEKVEMLLNAGADMHARDNAGNTVLWQAKMSNNPERDWVMYFLNQGVDPRVRNDLGYTFQFQYLYGGRADSGKLGAEEKRRREAARQWLTERGIPLETYTVSEGKP